MDVNSDDLLYVVDVEVDAPPVDAAVKLTRLDAQQSSSPAESQRGVRARPRAALVFAGHEPEVTFALPQQFKGGYRTISFCVVGHVKYPHAVIRAFLRALRRAAASCACAQQRLGAAVEYIVRGSSRAPAG